MVVNQSNKLGGYALPMSYKMGASPPLSSLLKPLILLHCLTLMRFEPQIVSNFSFPFIRASCDMQFCNLQGKKNPGTDRSSVLSFLEQVRKAKEMKIDRFCIYMVHLFGFIKQTPLVFSWKLIEVFLFNCDAVFVKLLDLFLLKMCLKVFN